jgi:hypothetical protein
VAVHPDTNVVSNGHVPEHPTVLKGPCDTQLCDPLGRKTDGVPTTEFNAPCVGSEQASNEIEKRGLAGAVRSDDTHRLAFSDL